MSRIYVKFNTGSRWSWGARWFDSIDKAHEYCKEKGYHGIYSVTRHDGFVVDGTSFQPHFNHSLGEWVETRKQFKQKMGKLGLMEAGTEPPPQQREVPKKNNYIADDMIDYVKEGLGVKVNDNFVKELKDDDEFRRTISEDSAGTA